MYKNIIISFLPVVIQSCLQLVAFSINYGFSRLINFLAGLVLSIIVTLVASIYFQNDFSTLSLLVVAGIGIYGFFIGSVPATKVKPSSVNYRFELQSSQGKKLVFNNPFDNFLVYAGANSGKTKSIGKPLLEQYIRNGFGMLLYDYKDYDYTKTAYSLIQKHNYPHKFYYLSFNDINRSHRVNPIKPGLVDEYLLIQLADDLLSSMLGESGKKDEWFLGALGILKGVFIRFYKDYPEYCNIPNVMNYIVHNDKDALYKFLIGHPESKALAKGFLDSVDSPRTMASLLSSLTNYIGDIAFNKKVSYVLSGDDFNFNLIDPQDPKLVTIVNSYQTESITSPLVSLMVSMSSRAFTMKNRVPFCYFLDEATTFKIRDFEKMPSVLREYLCSFVLITQSGSKIEAVYGKNAKSSIESNFSNIFLGRTKDVVALRNYGHLFSKKEAIKRSYTVGESTHSGSQSVTTNTNKEDRYESHFFTGLKAGEFVGTTANANISEFHKRFKIYDDSQDAEVPMLNAVTNEMLEKEYRNLVNLVTSLI